MSNVRYLWIDFADIYITDCSNLQSTVPVLTLAPRMFVINEKLFLFAIVDRYPFATCAKDIFV